MALTCRCAWLGYTYDGWPWFWASLAATVSALGWRLNASRALRVGAVAALAGFSSGIIQGADQKLPLIAWEWQHWQLLAAAMWGVGASFSVMKDRYWLETLCATLISAIYIYEYVNNDNSFRALIEALFAAMMLLSIGGVSGKLRRILRDGLSGRTLSAARPANAATGAASVAKAKAHLRKG